jgi:hypothetical protein
MSKRGQNEKLFPGSNFNFHLQGLLNLTEEQKQQFTTMKQLYTCASEQLATERAALLTAATVSPTRLHLTNGCEAINGTKCTSVSVSVKQSNGL